MSILEANGSIACAECGRKARAEYDQLQTENAKLRDALKALMIGTYAELCADRDEVDCNMCSMRHGKDECTVVDAMELLGIDVFGEPLGVEV